MDTSIQLRAYELFRAASERPAAEREGFLAARAAAEPEVAAAAIRMLADYESETEDDPGEAVPVPEWLKPRKGSVIDGWRIEDDLGFGGFGRVCRASRQIPGGIEEVAIKFLDMAPGEIPRFLRERQTLATLNHEGICKFIDGGATPAGVPFIVMEYVNGSPIDRHCTEGGKTLTARLNVFVKLCHAIEYAHRQGVVHRDLKPSNILVTPTGAVRVLDFGLAKLLEPDPTAPDRLTRTGQPLFTKAYASPEQINGGPLGMATDVYSLGVVLYLIVTGHLPLSEFALRGPDWMRVVAERDPLPPSQVLLIDPPAPGRSPASARPPETVTPRPQPLSRLKRAVRGDLDAVILTALKKDPGERYHRVERLRLDIQQFLNGSSVTVHRIHWWQRLGRWSVRHRTSACVIAASFLCVIYQWQRAVIREFDAVGEIYYERDALRRLQYLTESALPQIEDALPPDPLGRDARRATAQIHANLLWRTESLPNYVLLDLDASLGASALRCVREWESLGDSQSALAVIAPVLPRIARRYQLDRRDRPWTDLYEQLLRVKVEAHTRLHQETEAAEAARQLAAIERRVR